MKRLLLLAALFTLAPLAGAQPRNVYPIEGCSNANVRSALDAFQQENAPGFDLYVVCTEKSWQSLLKAHHFPSTVAAITDWKEGRIFIGPKPLVDTALLHFTVSHELEHLRCRCDLGEK